MEKIKNSIEILEEYKKKKKLYKELYGTGNNSVYNEIITNGWNVSVDNLIGCKFKSKKYGVSEWIDEIVNILVMSSVHGVKISVKGGKNGFLYNLEDIVIVELPSKNLSNWK